MNIDPVYDKSVFFEREDRMRINEQHPNQYRVISNHSGYGCEGGENFEHDDTGGLHNYSGVEDEILGKRIKWLILPLHESETDRHLIGLSG